MPWTPIARGRQALRPRRRRRRLCDVRLPGGDRRFACAGGSACALRRGDRGLRGERQLRFAALISSIWRQRIGQPSLVIALDSGCGNYDQLWCTTSLRGLVGGTLTVEMLTEGVHSGDAGGVVPYSFRVARQLLSRIEDEATGRIIPESFPRRDSRRAAAAGQAAAAAILGDECTDVSLSPRHAAGHDRSD